MVKDAYDMFFKNISMQFHDDSLVNALVEKAFSDAPNDYDIELINELKKTDVT